MQNENFASAYSKARRSDLCTPCGEELETTYGYEVDKKGLKQLVPNGQKNVWEKVQEYAEEVKLENVIARVTTGDTSMLRPDAIYQDITDAPKSMIEAMNQVHALEETYANLSNEAKQKYPTIESYVQAAGTAEWMEMNGYIVNDTTPMEGVVHNQTANEKIAEAVKEATPNE